MKQDKFYKEINQSLDEETPDILNKIKSSDRFFIPVKPPKQSFNSFNLRVGFAGAMAVFVLLFTFILSGNNGPVVASTITLDINPSIEITLDEFDNVINVIALNNDGNVIVDRDIDYAKYTVDQVIEMVINKAFEYRYITVDDNVVLISVKNSNITEKERVINYIESRIEVEAKKQIPNITILKERLEEQVENGEITEEEMAQIYHITIAKLRLIRFITDQDDSYTIEQLKDYSIVRLYRIQQDIIFNNNN